jgi:hypothetical protein
MALQQYQVDFLEKGDESDIAKLYVSGCISEHSRLQLIDLFNTYKSVKIVHNTNQPVKCLLGFPVVKDKDENVLDGMCYHNVCIPSIWKYALSFLYNDFVATGKKASVVFSAMNEIFITPLPKDGIEWREHIIKIHNIKMILMQDDDKYKRSNIAKKAREYYSNYLYIPDLIISVNDMINDPPGIQQMIAERYNLEIEEDYKWLI